MVKNDSLVRCRKCGKEKHIDFTECLRNGWAMCCGETMVLITTKADVGKAVNKVIDCQVPHSRKNTL